MTYFILEVIYYLKLNNEQLTAVRHVNGPMLVVAGPGSGKTKVLVERIRYLIEEADTEPSKILVITFSKKAALNMKERFVNITSDKTYPVTFGTFHSIFFHIILNHSHSKETLLDIKDKLEYIKFSGMQCNVKEFAGLEWQQNMLEMISAYKNIKDEVFDRIPGCFMTPEEKDNFFKIYNYYIDVCRKDFKIDFDDMLLRCYELLVNNNKILEYYREKFKYILIDEFQDINRIQYEIIKLMSGESANVFCVGDDDQSIYGFRGAYPDIMKCFLEDFKEAQTVHLCQNYRSGANIISLSNKIIKDNTSRIAKMSRPVNEGGTITHKIYLSKAEEEESIVKILKDMDETALRDTSIILRTNNEVFMYKGLLKKHDIDVFEYSYEHKTPEKSFIFKDIVSFLKFIYEDNLREYFIEFMNKPNKYIKRISLINERINPEDLLGFYRNDLTMLKEIKSFFDKLLLAKNMKKANLAIGIFNKSIGYDRYLTETAQNPTLLEEYRSMVKDITDIFANYDFSMSIDEYIRITCSETGENNVRINEGVHVITMHGSKGLEFDTVILPDVNEGVIPPKNLEKDNIEEERRLFYVAVTRAKNNLYIFSTKERNREISRFIKGKI